VAGEGKPGLADRLDLQEAGVGRALLLDRHDEHPQVPTLLTVRLLDSALYGRRVRRRKTMLVAIPTIHPRIAAKRIRKTSETRL
jgi:hypothetical protein